MDDILFLITDDFPFGNGETFIENEIEYLAKNYSKIYIISKNIIDSQTRIIPSNCKAYKMDKKYISMLNVLSDKNYILDFCKNFKGTSLKKILIFQFVSKIIELKILEIIKRDKLEKRNIIIYSYWFNSGAYAGISLKRKGIVKKIISRAHGYDLYTERGEQFFKEEILKYIDKLYPCSKVGEIYLKKIYKKYNHKIECSYLGVKKPDIEIKINRSKEKIIVSCSNMIPLKRVELIIESLKKLEEKKEYRNIKWIHFGDGVEMNKLSELAKNSLKYISYEFKGRIKNDKILEFYSKNLITFFIHLSSTEGLPVSMMEVQSYSIPIIATDVGGVSEIVNSEVGILLKATPQISDIVKAMEHMLSFNLDSYKIYQENSYKNWNNNFNAEKNYTKFIENIKNL